MLLYKKGLQEGFDLFEPTYFCFSMYKRPESKNRCQTVWEVMQKNTFIVLRRKQCYPIAFTKRHQLGMQPTHSTFDKNLQYR